MTVALLKRSSVHHVQAHHHARFLQRDGWEIAASYGDSADESAAARDRVVLIDESWLGKLECKGDWVGSLDSVTIQQATFHKWFATHGMWIVQPGAMTAAKQVLEAKRAAQPRCYLLDSSSCYASFRLVGPHAAEVLCKLASAQVAVGGHTLAPVAGVPCFIVRREQWFQFHFGREFGEYMWECFLDAGEEFGIAPAGVDILK